MKIARQRIDPVLRLLTAALAFRRNLPFDIDSEYLPMRLVRGEF